MERLIGFIEDERAGRVYCRWKCCMDLLQMELLNWFIADGRVDWACCRRKG